MFLTCQTCPRAETKDEKEYTGFYITGHPLDAYRDELEGLFQLGRLAENPEDFDGKTVTIGGLITEKVDRLTKAKQEKNVHLNLGRFHRHRTVVVFPQGYQKKSYAIATGWCGSYRGTH